MKQGRLPDPFGQVNREYNVSSALLAIFLNCDNHISNTHVRLVVNLRHLEGRVCVQSSRARAWNAGGQRQPQWLRSSTQNGLHCV